MTEVAHSVFVSARSDEWDVIEEYVTKFGNDVNELDDLGFTGLHICATTGAVAAAHTYLTHGANLSIADRESGWLALHRSLYFKHIKVSLLLLAFGATIDGGVDNTKSKGTLHIYDNEGLSPSALLSRMLASRPAMNNRVSNVAYSFGKSDFTLGIPLPNAARVAQAKRLETLLDKRLKQVCAGKHHSLAITEDGQLFSWGYGRWGRLGQGNEVDQPEPGLISALWQAKIYVKQVASGEHHTIAVSSEGDVYTWGSDRCGQLGHGKSLRSQQHVVRKDSASQDKEIDNEVLLSEPRRVEALRRSFVLQVAAGDAHSLCFAKGDELYAWGSNRSGQLGLKATELSHLPGGAEGTSTPRAVYIEHAGKPRRSSVMRKASSSSHRPSPEVMVQLAAAHNNSLLLCRNANLDTQGGLVRGSICSEVFQWGHGIFDPARLQFSSRESSRTVFTKNNGDNNPTSEFTAVGKAKHIKITQITAGQHHFAGVCSDGCVYTWKVEGGDCSVEPAAVGPERREERIDERISAKGSLSAPKVFEAMLPERGGGHVTHVAASSRRMSATTADGDLFTWDLHGGKVTNSEAWLLIFLFLYFS